MEISKMLTLSTGHVKESTLDLLEKEPVANNFPEIAVYEKAEYGFFLYLTGEELADRLDQFPSDLALVVGFALDAGCKVLCLDCDGDQLEELPFYDGDAIQTAPEKPYVRRKVGIAGRGRNVALAVGKAIERYFNARKEENASDNDIDAELTEFFSPAQLQTVYTAMLETAQATPEKKPQSNQNKNWTYPDICDTCTNIGGELCGSCAKLGGNTDLYAKRPSCEDLHGPCYKCRHCPGWWETEEVQNYLRETVKEYLKDTVHSRHIDADGKAHIYMCSTDSFQQTVWDHRFGSEDHDTTLYEEVIQDLQPGVEHHKQHTLEKILEVLESEIRDVPFFQEEELPEDGKTYLKELISEYTVFEMPSRRMMFLWYISPDSNLWDLMNIEKIMAAGANDHSMQTRMVGRQLLRVASKEDREKYCDKLIEINSWLSEMADLFELTEAELYFFCTHTPRTVFHWIFEQEIDT